MKTYGAMLLGLVLFAAGCSGSKEEEKDVDRPAEETTEADGLPRLSEVEYDGQTAKDWALAFYDADPDIALRAAFALNKIGAESLRFFRDGLKHTSEGTRYLSLNQLPYKAASAHKDVFLLLLTDLLKDGSPRVRRAAGFALLQCNFKEALPALKTAVRVEHDRETKRELQGYIDLLEKK
jgi:HEAT repeat protein